MCPPLESDYDHAMVLVFPAAVTRVQFSELQSAMLAQLARTIKSGLPLEWLELDLSATEEIDSAGIGLIVSLIRKAKSFDAQVRARVGNSTVERVLKFTQLHQNFELIEPDPAACC